MRCLPFKRQSKKWSNTLKQFVRNLLANCLSGFDHFVKLALKGLSNIWNVSNSIVLNLNFIPLLKRINVFSFLRCQSWVISWQNNAFSIRISENYSKLSRDVFQYYFLHEGKNSLKISFLQECTSNLVTDFDFKLHAKSFVNVHLEKVICRCYTPAKNFVGGNHLAVPGRIASRYQRRRYKIRNQNRVENLRWSCLQK